MTNLYYYFNFKKKSKIEREFKNRKFSNNNNGKVNKVVTMALDG